MSTHKPHWISSHQLTRNHKAHLQPHTSLFTRRITSKFKCDQARTKSQLLSYAYSSSRSLYTHCIVCLTQNIHTALTYSTKHFTSGNIPPGPWGTDRQSFTYGRNGKDGKKKLLNCDSLHTKEEAANRNLSNCTKIIKLRNLDNFLLTKEFKWKT